MKKNKYGSDFTIYSNGKNKVKQVKKVKEVKLTKFKVDFKSMKYESDIKELFDNYYKEIDEKCAEIDEINFLKLNTFKTYPNGFLTNTDELEKQLKETKKAYGDLKIYLESLKASNNYVIAMTLRGMGIKSNIQEDIEKIEDYLNKLDFKNKLESKYPEKNIKEKGRKI